jgi:hypothetical protein
MVEVIYTFLQLSLRMRLGSHTGVPKRVLARKDLNVPVTIQLVLRSWASHTLGKYKGKPLQAYSSVSNYLCYVNLKNMFLDYYYQNISALKQ